MLEAARDRVRETHRQLPGMRVAEAYSRDIDEVLVRHLDWLVAGNPEFGKVKKRSVIAAVGGYGRREMNLHSDIDLLFLFRREPDALDEEFIKAFVYPVWDLKVDLGHVVKTVDQIVEEVGHDVDTTTAVIGAHSIWGDTRVRDEVLDRCRAAIVLKHSRELVDALIESTRARHRKYANTRLLLEPSVKEAPGGLRDLHVMMWLAYIRFGEASLSALTRNGVLSPREQTELEQQHDFLIEVRNSMHLFEGRKIDMLNFERQIKVADDLGFAQKETGLPEEQFMRTYYEHVEIVDRLLRRVIQRIQPEPDDTPEGGSRMKLRSRRLEGFFWTRDREIRVEQRDAAGLMREPSWIMHFFAAASLYDLTPDEFTLDLIQEQAPRIDDEYRGQTAHRERFLMILRQPLSGPATLRTMHRCRFLDAYIPEFAAVRNLPRIDYYHQFTVDEHLLRAAEAAGDLLRPGSGFDKTHAAGVAKDVMRWDLLVFALLIHDLGKGEGRGHVIRGAHMIQRICDRMGFSPRERGVLHLLVAKHQKMSHVALKRNTEDPSVPEDLARDVGTPEMLRMLYVLTCCDLRSVSDESWNDWRGTLLASLYERTMNLLTGPLDSERRSWKCVDEVPRLVVDEVKAADADGGNGEDGTESDPEETPLETSEVSTFIVKMPPRYRHSTPPQQIARHMRMVKRMKEADFLVMEVEQTEESNYSILHCVARDAPGLFCHLCGALSSRGINILSAQIYTASNGICIDVFQIQDSQNRPPTDATMFERLREKLNEVLRGERKVSWREQLPKKSQPISAARLDLRPPTVTVSNDESAEGYTILEVKAPDRPGLLFDIASVLEKFRIHVHIALVATESYQVVDVFYVTNWENDRLEPGTQTKELHEALLAATAPSDPVNPAAP